MVDGEEEEEEKKQEEDFSARQQMKLSGLRLKRLARQCLKRSKFLVFPTVAAGNIFSFILLPSIPSYVFCMQGENSILGVCLHP